jgi:hypothetical protein
MNRISSRILPASLVALMIMFTAYCAPPLTEPPAEEAEFPTPTDTPSGEIQQAPLSDLCPHPPLPDEMRDDIVWGDVGDAEEVEFEWGGDIISLQFLSRRGAYTNEKGQLFLVSVYGPNEELVLEYTDSLKICMEISQRRSEEPKSIEEEPAPEIEFESEDYTAKDILLISFEPDYSIQELESGDGFDWVYVIDPKIAGGKIHNYLRYIENGYTNVNYYAGLMGAGLCVRNSAGAPVATPNYKGVPPTAVYKYPSVYSSSSSFYYYRLTVWGRGGYSSEYALTGIWSYYTRYAAPPPTPTLGAITCPTPTPRP